MDVNNELFMTNIANQNKDKTFTNEFENINYKLPAPDILRIRFEIVFFFNNLVKIIQSTIQFSYVFFNNFDKV